MKFRVMTIPKENVTAQCGSKLMIEATDFRNAMSLLTGAVNVVATTGASGRYGFTASAVCSVTDTPPTLLVCMNKSSNSHVHFIKNKILTVNVLGVHHQPISKAFSSNISSEERFKHGEWTELETGAPVLEDSLASFDCQIEQIQEVGTHDIFICRIVAIQQTRQDQGLVYFNRAYHHVGKTTVA
ncbi:MAG TPA: flavin reductase [Cellvibrio sp.]|nr:flavin reductase [Cellvibrio sp.]